MSSTYYADSSPEEPVRLASHLRRRSSISQPLANPFVSRLVYDELTGEISLPSSPPLLPWKSPYVGRYRDDKHDRYDEKQPQLPPYSYGAPPIARFSIPRRWVSVLLLTSGTFCFILLFSYLIPVSTSAAILSRIPKFSTSSTPTCEPYSSFGTLSVDSSEPDNNKWVPFDLTCAPPNFFAQLRDAESSSDFSWLHNRTALIIGDSISREHVENFCSLMGEESEVVRKSHKWSPTGAAVRSATKATQSSDKPARLVYRRYRVVRDASLPRVCYIPRLDFLLVSVFHFGLDQEDYWRGSSMPQYTSPGMFEHRLADVVVPLMRNLRADGRRSAPDFVEVSSGTWDLARWAEQDTDEQRDTDGGLTQERVTWYRFRVGQLLETIRKSFPQAKTKTWRTLHYPQDQAAEQDYFMDKISPRTNNASAVSSPPYFSHNRIYQLDQAVRSLVLPSVSGEIVTPAPHADFRLNEWGPILKGQEAHQKDRLHGDPLPGGYVWGDIFLYEMWRGARASENQPMRTEGPR